MDLSPTDVAWLAGLLEGEGSFYLNKNHVNGMVYRYPVIVVNMTDRDVIERVASLFGTGVYDLPSYQEGRQPAFRTQITGKRAAALMVDLFPYMGRRRAARITDVLNEYRALDT